MSDDKTVLSIYKQYQVDSAQRRAQAFRMRQEGSKVSQIARELQITPQRVYQLLGAKSK